MRIDENIVYVSTAIQDQYWCLFIQYDRRNKENNSAISVLWIIISHKSLLILQSQSAMWKWSNWRQNSGTVPTVNSTT